MVETTNYRCIVEVGFRKWKPPWRLKHPSQKKDGIKVVFPVHDLGGGFLEVFTPIFWGEDDTI